MYMNSIQLRTDSYSNLVNLLCSISIFCKNKNNGKCRNINYQLHFRYRQTMIN